MGRAWPLALLAFAPVAAACTSTTPAPPPAQTVTQTQTRTATRTVTPSVTPTAIPAGPTTAHAAPSCPWLDQQATADDVGMRLTRITVLRSGGHVVGCRFYALQDSPLHNSEHLPGPHQPAVEVSTQRYRAARDAHNAFVLLARTGSNVLRAKIAPGNTGLCFQIAFYPRDHGRDWACAFSVGATAVTVRTVVVTPALNVIEVTRRVAAAIRSGSVQR